MQTLRDVGTTVIMSGLWAAVGAGSASAQQSSSVDPAVDGIGLDEIVVTAQRRSETAQSVPMSISAFSAETLSRLNIVSTEDLAKITPGLQFGSASLQRNEIAIRGIGSNRFDAGGESSSAVFIDDVYQPQFSNLLVDLLDVDRVEVLKGPQGTLYGRNTIGGAIAVYTPPPSKDLEVSARIDAGSKNLLGGMVSVSGPVSNSVSASISAGYRQRDGFMKDLVSGKDDGISSYGVRGKILYEPNDRLKLTLIGATFASTQDAVLLHRTTNFVFLLNPAVVTTVEPDRYQGGYTTPGGAATHTGMASAHLDYSGDVFKLTSITSYQRSTSHDAEDDDSSQYDTFDYDDNLKAVSISQEFRIGSNDADVGSAGRLKWVAGLYYFRENASEPGIFHFGQDSVFVGLADFLGVPYPSAGIIDSVDRQINVQSYAGFGQATYPLTDRLNLTLGARYTKDQKSVDSQGNTNLPGFPLVAAPFTAYHSQNWDKFTPKATVDYKITEQALAYATWAQGYQSGAPQSVTFNPLLAQRFADPETVTTVEVGLKSELFDRRLRLNAAVFDSKFKNLQVRRVVDLGGGVAQPAVDNAADSTIKGFEFQTAWVASENLRLDLGYAYTDARYGTYISNSTPGAIVDLSGNRLPRAPKSAVTAGARYELPLRNEASVAFGVLTTYTSTQFFQPENLPEEEQSGYATTDLTLTYAFPGKRWTATAWVNNLFDREYRTYAEALAPSGRDSWSDLRAGGITVRFRL